MTPRQSRSKLTQAIKKGLLQPAKERFVKQAQGNNQSILNKRGSYEAY